MTPAQQCLFDIVVCLEETLYQSEPAYGEDELEEAIKSLDEAQLQHELLLTADLAISVLNTENLRELQRRMTRVARPGWA
jgi:hypothetical protein